MGKRKVNKDNPKNRYCAHCVHWKDIEENKYGDVNGWSFGYITCKKSGKRINYWNCCKDFEFEMEGD